MKKHNFTKDNYQEIQDEISEWYGIKVAITEIKKILKEDDFLTGLCFYEDDGKIVFSFDKREIEQFNSIIAYKLTGMDWPTGKTNKKDRNEFFQELKKGLVKNKKLYKSDIDWSEYDAK